MKAPTESPIDTAAPDLSALPSAPPPRPRRGWVRPLILTIVGLAVAGWITHFLYLAYHYEETDNAYVVGHLHQVSPQIDGQVKEVLVTDNQTVAAGDPLVRLDPLEFEIARQKARAGLEQSQAQEAQAAAAASQAEAQIAEAQARVAQAEAQLTQTEAQLNLARLTLGRQEQLLAQNGASTQAEVDNARSVFNTAEASHAANRANLVAAHAAVGSAEATRAAARAQAQAAVASVAVFEAALHDAERTLSYATLTAPAAGRIGNKAVESGNRVVAGQLLLALAEPNVWVVANFKETQLPLIRTGQDVEITIDALPGRRFVAKVDSIAPASGAQFALLPPDNATGNFNKVVQRIPVKITLAAADQQELSRTLRLGYSVIVRIRVR